MAPGRITIETGNVTFTEDDVKVHPDIEAGKYVYLHVSDTGIGMDADTIAHIFEPFFTTKSVGEGTGLGLSTVFGIVKQNNGFIDVYSKSGLGTTLKIYFAKCEDDAEHLNKSRNQQPLPRGSETILVVEDERAILDLTRKTLGKLGYNVLAASNPYDAIEIVRDNTCTIDLLLTDVVMPEMNGKELSDYLHNICPEIKSLFMSGYMNDVIAKHGIVEKGMNFISKPFSILDLSTKVRTILDSTTVP